jgi:hypothetical protein
LWLFAAIIFLLAGVGPFGQNLIIATALGGAAMARVVFGMQTRMKPPAWSPDGSG